MSTGTRYLLCALCCAVLLTAACGGKNLDDCTVGAEGCACTQGGGCDPDLCCWNGTCHAMACDAAVIWEDAALDGGVPDTGTPQDGGLSDAAPDGGVVVVNPPSCSGMTGTECGGESCCLAHSVPGGWFAMGRSEGTACTGTPQAGAGCTAGPHTCFANGTTWGCPDGTWLDLGGDDREAAGGADEVPEHAAQVTGFVLDKYEVTVARMRAFVNAYDKATLLTALAAGAGAHPLLPGSGWQAGWDSQLPDNDTLLSDALQCDAATQTWTASAGANESFPITCVSWYLAYAFCAWDEARLPTAAEWEYVAAGGEQNRLYPWGTDAPTASHAVYLDSGGSPHVNVFDKPAGAGRWSHHGLAGSAWEWVYDLHEAGWYAGAGLNCRDCANLTGSGARVMRGGSFNYTAANLRAAERFPGTAGAYWLGSGIRCARD
jgi:formylglycine-generating enzyme required for sulfatase activity